MKESVWRAARLAVAACVIAAAGCAKDPTAVTTDIHVGANVPPLLRLRTRITLAADPARQSVAERSSSTLGDAADRPGPFLFPIRLQLTVDSSLAGPVVITVEGLDWDTDTVLARGATDAEVVAEATTAAVVTLAATAP